MARYLFLLAKTKDRKFKQKTEGKKEKQKKPTYLGHPGPTHLPSRPSPPFPLSSFPGRRTAAWRPCRGRRRAPGHLLLPLAFSSRLEASHSKPHPFPPLLIVFLLLCSSFSSTSESRRSAPPWQTWPPCPRDRAVVSLVPAVVVFIAGCKQSKPGAPSTSPSSSTPRRSRRTIPPISSPP